MDIIKSINHRMQLLDQTDKELTINDRTSERDTSKLDQKISFELESFKNETKSLLQECEVIRKAVFRLGSQLREKVSSQEFEIFDNTKSNSPLVL